MTSIRWAGVSLGAISLLTAFRQPAAYADTPAFPDISGYASVASQDYLIAFNNPGRAATTTAYFLAPEGVTCVIEGGGAACFGSNLPGVSALPNPDETVTYIDTQKGVYQSSNPGHVLGNTIHGQPIRTLPASHTITVDGVICGVDNLGTTACKDAQGRGFILSPTWSGWLPKV